MQEFKIRQDGFKEIKKQTLKRVVPLMLIVMIAGLAISIINSKDRSIDLIALPIIIPIVTASIGFGLYRGINRQRASFESYTLTVMNNMISREQLNMPVIAIYNNDIKEIVKNKNGSFTIRGKDSADIINVPAQIDNYSELEAALNRIKPVTIKSTVPVLQKYSGLLSLMVIGLMLCVYTVANKIVVALSGIVFVGLAVWSLYETQRSKNIDSKTKRNMWWILVVLASVIAVMVMKLGFL